MLDEVGALVAPAGHDVDDARRQSCGLGGLGEDDGVEHGLRGRLDHHRATGGEGRCVLEGREGLGVVPRHDGADDTDGLALHLDDAAHHALAQVGGLLFDEVGVVPQQRGRVHGLHLAGDGDGHAVLRRDERGDLLTARFEFIGEAAQVRGALGRLEPGPDARVVEGLARGGHRRVDVGAVRERYRADLLAGVRRYDGDLLAAVRLAPLAADE